ncbi:MAG: ATP-binding cassette domain-containing protein [Pseudomonadota bacterium]
MISCRNSGILYREEPSDPDTALAGILVDTLEISAGSVCAVMGESGSGKSTLLSLVSGLKEANVCGLDAGSSLSDVHHGDKASVQLLHRQLPPPGTLGYVFQDSLLMRSLPVSLNLEMARSLTAGKLSDQQLSDLIVGFGLANKDEDPDAILQYWKNRRVRDLSGGQQQRIAVGRAIASEPEVIFCDEPTSSLDDATARKIMEFLYDWTQKTGGSVIWVTHDEDLALSIADSLLYVRNGQVVSKDGQPFSINKDSSLVHRKEWLANIKNGCERQPKLRASELPDRGIGFIGSDVKLKNAAQSANKQSKGQPFKPRGIFRFIYHFVIAELFERQVFSSSDETLVARFFNALWRGPYSFSKPTFALILCLGILTCYATLLGLKTLDQLFDYNLSRPQVAHFTLSTRGKAATEKDERLSTNALRALSQELQGTLSPLILPDARPPKAYGRRFDLFANVASAGDEDNRCGGASARDGAASLLVFQHAEPLYEELVVDTPNGPRQVIDYARKDLRGAALVTRGFLRRALKIEDPSVVPDGFCFGEVDFKYVAIAGVVSELPGSAELQFEFAMTNDAYLRLHRENPPASWGRGWPPFQTAALYFDSGYAQDLFCIFDECEERTALFRPDFATDYKLNEDALEQIKRLIGVAVGGKGLLVGVISVMLIVVAIAVALSVNAFISSNERFLCIMRAFGYRLRHIQWLFLLEFLGITIAATLPFAIIVGLFHFAAVPWLTALFGLDPVWMAAEWSTILSAIGAGYILVAAVGLAILGYWWWSNRYVGGKLQSL